MATLNGISEIHIEKLGHKLEEIRLRTLENIISKFDHGFKCNCDSVRNELLSKLFNLFTFNEVSQSENTNKILNLIHTLIQNNEIIVSNFGIKKFKSKLEDLKNKLNPIWHNKLNEIDEVASQQSEIGSVMDSNIEKTDEEEGKTSQRCYHLTDSAKTEATVTSEVESESKLESFISKKSLEYPIKCLVMPWQCLISSDRGVLSAIEEALNTTSDYSLIARTCQFITNIMLQDFPAEIFLQRPSIISILQSHLVSCTNNIEPVLDAWDVIPAVIRVFYKLTKSLRFRMNYYSDSSIVNFINKDNNLSNKESFEVSEFNYHSASSDNEQSNIDNTEDTEDSLLQSQQMLIPTYCTETLNLTLKLLSIPVSSIRPLKNIKFIIDLVFELVQVLTECITPSIWLYSDPISVNINENLKNIMSLIGEILEYLRNYNSMDYLRITYLQLLCIVTKLLRSLVPLEISDYIVPSVLKISLSISLMDAPIYLIYPKLSSILQKYSRNFKSLDEIQFVQLFDETNVIIKSMKAAIFLLKAEETCDQHTQKILKIMYTSKLSLPYHKNFSLIKRYVSLFQSIHQPLFSADDKNLVNRFVLYLLANENEDIRLETYNEFYNLVSFNLNENGDSNGNDRRWTSMVFLFDPNIWTEIICFGVDGKNKRIKSFSREMLLLLINGKSKMGEIGWENFLSSFIPVLPLLQCFADVATPFGKAITKMLDPDVYHDMKLPYLEMINGNIRLLYSLDNDIREEALYRLIYLLGVEKNSKNKLPKLISLHGLPLNSLFIFERKLNIRKPDGNYQKTSLMSTLEILKLTTVEPKIKKSALVQISLMLNDSSLHQSFLKQDGLKLIINILDRALVENDYEYYPDSVIPILTIFKLLLTIDMNIRHELLDNNNNPDSHVIINIMRSVYLFPNNNNVKSDASYLLFILLYSNFIVEIDDDDGSISIPNAIASNVYTPMMSKSHWKISPNCQHDTSVNFMNNEIGLTFIRQFWAYYWNLNEYNYDDDDDTVNFQLENIDLNSQNINSKLIIRKEELDVLKYTSINYYCQQQLLNIDNSKSHIDVTCSLDYLWMYIKLYERYKRLGFIKNLISLTSMPWAHSFQRFLLSHPTNKEDCDLFVDVLNFLYIFINVTNKDTSNNHHWLIKIMKNTTKLLPNLCQNLDNNNHQDIYQSILKLVRSCSNLNDDDNFIELVISNLLSLGDEQHFYNLVYLDWLLTCLIHLTNKTQLNCDKNLLKSLGNILIELIISFHANGSVSFMGLSITRNSILCLNHLLHHIEKYLNKPKEWMSYWYEDGKTLDWLSILWKNRDRLIRASALQFLSGLIKTPHAAQQLLHSLNVSFDQLCKTLIKFIINREESCTVKEQSITALNYLIKNIRNPSFDYDDSPELSKSVINFIEHYNVYHEISLLFSSIYLPSTLNHNDNDEVNENFEKCDDQSKALHPFQYYCHDEMISNKNSIDGDDYKNDNIDNFNEFNHQYLSTPSLITSLCKLLNSLIASEKDVIKQMYQHSLDKYFIACFQPIETIMIDKNDDQFYEIIEMYINVFTVLSNCIINCQEFAAVVKFSPDFFYIIFSFLNDNDGTLTDRLWSEIYHLISLLSLTHNQHVESLKIAIEVSNFQTIFKSINNSIDSSNRQLQMNAIACLGFLLSQEISRADEFNNQLGTIFDSTFIELSDESKSSNKNEDEEGISVGSLISKSLTQLFIAFNYVKSEKKIKKLKDKELIIGTLSNLLCVSYRAKKTAIDEDLCGTCVNLLRDFYNQLNLEQFNVVTYHIHKTNADRDKKVHPLLNDINRILTLLINFAYNSLIVKRLLSESGIADILHKMWAWILLNDSVLITSLKLMITLTTNCPEASQSLTLTTIVPGTGPRKTPNTTSLIHVVIHLISKEIDKTKISSLNDSSNEKLRLSFHVLRNSIRAHECRVSIAKSNLLEFFTKIHPQTTKRTKSWVIIENYCLQFLLDFTFYEEGQLSVAKAVDGLDVLIQLSKSNTQDTRILALSTLRNLVFNLSNRPKFLCSVEFTNLLHSTLKSGSLGEIEIAGQMFWSLIANNQKGKLLAKTAGFKKSIQDVLGRLTFDHREDLSSMFQYLLKSF